MFSFTRRASIVIVALFAVFGVVGIASGATSFSGQGNVAFDSIKVGVQGVGGVTFFNGSIVNETTTNGVDNPVTFGDNVRIDGRVFRGATQGPGDGMPFAIDDDLQVTGALSAGSISGLSSMIASSMSGYATTGALNNLQAQIDDTNSTLSTWADTLNAWTDEIVTTRNDVYWNFKFTDCVTFYAQYTLYVESSDIIDCWNTWRAGKPIPVPITKSTSASAGDIQILGGGRMEIAPEYEKK